MTFPLEQFATAVAAHAQTWTRLEFAWQTGPISPNYGKPVVRWKLDSAEDLDTLNENIIGPIDMVAEYR